MKKLTGVPTSGGIAIGAAFKWEKMVLNQHKENILFDFIDEEKQRYFDAVTKSKDQINNIIENLSSEKTKQILSIQLILLDDPSLENIVLSGIENNLYTVEKSLSEGFKSIKKTFESVDEYFRERLCDVQDVLDRIISVLNDQKLDDLSNIGDVVLVAQNLTPSDIASLGANKILGFVTDLGGQTSHTSILARDMGLPAVIGCKSAYNQVENGTIIIIDGTEGEIIINPSDEIVELYRKKQEIDEGSKKNYSHLHSLDAVTKDGRYIEIGANIGSDGDIGLAAKNGARGIGLFRTEFIFLDNYHLYSEPSETLLYKSAINQMNGHPVTIRTHDIGGDKGFLDEDGEFFQLNPALGYRGIRYSLDKPHIFKSQLRAILHASAYGKVRVLFPMIISLDEILQCKKYLSECMDELSMDDAAFDSELSFGIMVETPAAVFMADTFIDYVDFFSIGTNDLTQHILAVDRTNEKVGKMFNLQHPAVLKAIRHVVDIAHQNDKQVEICGEFAHDKYMALLLLGMGIDRFSMGSGYIPEIKHLFINSSYDHAKSVADNVVKMKTVDEVDDYLEKMFSDI